MLSLYFPLSPEALDTELPVTNTYPLRKQSPQSGIPEKIPLRGSFIYRTNI